MSPATSSTSNALPAATGPRYFRRNFPNRYVTLGGLATTGSWLRCRVISAAPDGHRPDTGFYSMSVW